MYSNNEKYMNFREGNMKNKLDQIEFTAKCKQLDDKKFIRIPFTTVTRNILKYFEESPKLKGVYMIRSNSCPNIRKRTAYDDLYIYYKNGKSEWYSTNAYDDKKNKQISGTRCTRYVQDRFKARTGMSFKEVFGSTKDILKICVPKSFYYYNDEFDNKELDHVSAIDYCSQYPSMLCGRLPTSIDCVTYDGQIDPDEKYPFAFYIKSGHCAEYKVFDTRKWKYNTFSESLLAPKDNSWNGNLRLPPDDDVTILMKASPYSLTEEMYHYYAKRKSDPFAKQVMVSLIGCFHMDYYKTYPLAHLAAVVIARANDRMANLAEHIEMDGNKVLHICVDGCIYKGSKEYGVDVKSLMNCYQEFTDCKFKMKGMNCYVAMKDGKVQKFKHGAYDTRKDGQDIETVCNGLDDIYQWYKQTTELQEIERWEDKHDKKEK